MTSKGTTCSDQSNTAALPPPNGSLGVLTSRDQVFPPFLVSSSLQIPRSQPDVPLSERSPLVRWQVPADVGARLAESLNGRWQSYDQQHCQCRKHFSEKSVHQLRVATRRLMTQFGYSPAPCRT